MSPPLALMILQGDIKSARKEIQARYDALDRGFRKRNPAVLDGLMTDDFTTESPDGKPLGRDAALASFRGLILGAQKAKWPRKVTKLRFDGTDAVATVDGHFDGLLPGPDGKPHRTELITTVEDTWTKTSAGWRIRRSRMVKMAMRRDGKAVAP